MKYTDITFTQQIGATYYLSTDGFTFKYRYDKYAKEVIRADLFKNGDKVSSVRVSAGYGMKHRSHHNVINHFESVIMIQGLNDANTSSRSCWNSPNNSPKVN